MRTRPGFQSIRYRLPLLICGLLFVFAVAAFGAAYVEVKRAALDSADKRLRTVADEMASILEQSTGRMRTQMYAIAHRPQILRAFTSGDSAVRAATRAGLDSLVRPGTQIIGSQLRHSDGSVLLATGDTVTTGTWTVEGSSPNPAMSDSVFVGPHGVGEDSVGAPFARYALTAVVRDSLASTLGYLTLHLRLNSASTEIARIRELIGSDVGMFLGSPGTNVWTDLAMVVEPPPAVIVAADTTFVYQRPDGGEQLAAARNIRGTPWVALIEFPALSVLAGAHRVAAKFALIGAALLLLGAIAAYMLSRDITNAIAKLSDETAHIAGGDYSRRVVLKRNDELGRLAGSFNSMAVSVGNAMDALAADIRERKRAEEALLEADEMIRSMVESSPLPIMSLDNEGRVKLWNRASEQVFGWSVDEMLGQPLPVITEQQRQAVDEVLARAAQGEVLTGVEVATRRRDGTPLMLKVSCGATYDAGGNSSGVTAIFEDVTQSRKLEEQLRQAQKMDAVGRLAGGIAHDFNNLLTVVLGASDMVLTSLPAQAGERATVKEIRDAGERAAALTTQLLAFSRKQLVEPKVFALNDMVSSIDRMLRRLLGEDVRITVSLEPKVWMVEADRGQMEQVLVNLAVNARDAMPRGGKLMIETKNVVLDESYTGERADVHPGEYVMLAVSDTGTGMSEHTLAHLFEPFFTTKSAGKGTGLGLATSYGIVKQARGHIAAYSEEGVGTTMKVYLPRVPTQEDALVARPEPIARGHETILLVEDDKAVRNITRRMLEGHGYAVLEAEDGPAALDILRAHLPGVDLLFTDVVLPGMGGREVAERARELRADIKVLFASGYTDDVILQHKLLEHDVTLLQKPFSSQELARKVRMVLEGNGKVQ